MLPVTSFSMTGLVVGQGWSGEELYMEGRADLYRLDNGTLTAVRHRDEILGRIVRPYTAAVGSGFLLVYENAAETHLANILIIYIILYYIYIIYQIILL